MFESPEAESDIVPGVISAQALEVRMKDSGLLTTGRLLGSRGLCRSHLGCRRALCRALCRALPRSGLLLRDGDHPLPWGQGGRHRLGRWLQRTGLPRGSTRWRLRYKPMFISAIAAVILLHSHTSPQLCSHRRLGRGLRWWHFWLLEWSLRCDDPLSIHPRHRGPGRLRGPCSHHVRGWSRWRGRRRFPHLGWRHGLWWRLVLQRTGLRWAGTEGQRAWWACQDEQRAVGRVRPKGLSCRWHICHWRWCSLVILKCPPASVVHGRGRKRARHCWPEGC